MGRLEGQIAIIKGAASGPGLATSKRLAAERTTIVMVDRREDEIRRAAEGGGRRLDPNGVDITKSAHFAALLTAALFARFRSRKDHTFLAEKLLSAMRGGFGGHKEPEQQNAANIVKPKA
jgi:NAD(P)-dependent dehydrogenase (short-subunit alcohol dehydrogenase family)